MDTHKRRPLTEAEVHEAATALDLAGMEPTHRALLAKLGGGSYTQIGEFKRTWKSPREVLPDAGPVPSNLVERGDNLMAEIWRLASALAEKRANEREEAVKRDLALADAARKELTAELDEMVYERNKAVSNFAAGQAEFEAMRLKVLAAEAMVKVLRDRELTPRSKKSEPIKKPAKAKSQPKPDQPTV